MREVRLDRNTAETQSELTLGLDGAGIYQVDTGCGFLNHMLELFARHGRFDLVLTCGPNVMMQGVYRLCAEKGVPCLASLERKMACGLGACLGCTCHTKVGPKTVCQDGPVFPAQEVFDLG